LTVEKTMLIFTCHEPFSTSCLENKRPGCIGKIRQRLGHCPIPDGYISAPVYHLGRKKIYCHGHTGSTHNIFAIEVNGEACGSIGLHLQPDIYRKNAELGYWLARPYHGRGIMTGAVNQMVKYGFDTFAIDRIYARPFGNNPASKRVLEKAGFNLEAQLSKTLLKNGEMLDELIYAVRRSV